MGQIRVPWDQCLGERIREARQNKGWTQERLALGIRRSWDLGWSRATVTAIESGQRELSAKELFALLDVLVMSPAEFLGDPSVDTTTQLVVGRGSEMAEAGSVALRVVLGVIEGGRRGWTADDYDMPWIRTASEQIRSLPQISGELEAAGVKATAARCMAVLDGEGGEAEKKVAARLEVTLREVAIRAVKLWDQTLTDEREARLKDRHGDTPDNSAQSLRTTRGHITRELTAELILAIAGN